MNVEKMRTSALDLVYLVKCAVDGVVPDKERIAKTDLVDVRHISEKHMLSSAAAYALESAGIKDADFEKDKAAAIWLTMQYDHYREEIFDALDKRGIWYLLLKGAVIKDWYPEYSMRQMADNDILIDGSRREEVREVMEELGFKVESFGRGTHDVYQLPPQLDFEMHVILFGAFVLPRVTEYYENIKERL
ncbi:MAG: nucleotidyltransferase family protein, partial [Clostridia bacterium]|nr:nucleotidyltransferase family protein [Clostridia bacterium]